MARLNEELSRVIGEQTEPDFSQYEEKIEGLSAKLRDLSASEKDWREKEHRLELKVKQAEEDCEKSNRDVTLLID